MKSYSGLEQSKKLAEILPPESADMIWISIDNDESFDGSWEVLPKTSSLIAKDDNQVPCWSLAALLDIIPSGQVNKVIDSNKWESSSWNDTDFEPMLTVGDFDNPVDACVEMILALKEKDLL